MKELPNKWKAYLQNGEWTGPDQIRVDGKWVDVAPYLGKQSKPKKVEKQINIDIVTDKDYADLEQPLDKGYPEVDGDGDSESSE
jgi:hypothetical protein